MLSDRFHVTSVDAVQVVELMLPEALDSDEFDRLNDSILTVIDGQHGGRWIFDLSRVAYMGSAALGLLVNIRQKIQTANGRLVLCGLSPRLLQLFHACCLERLFIVARDRHEALHDATRA